MEVGRAKLLRLIYSLKDFQMALSAYDFLTECDLEAPISTVNLRRFKSYETTMVVSYMRPFSSADGEIKKMSFDDLDLVLTPDQEELHSRIRILRNKVFAHSDGDRMRLLAKPLKINMKDGFSFSAFQTSFDEGLEFSDYQSLMAVGCLIRLMFEATWESVHRSLGESCNWDEIRQDHYVQI